MKKSLPIIVIVLLLLLGGGAFLAFRNKTTQPETARTNQSQAQNGNVITSIKDALTKSQTLECVYKDDEGTETTSHIKGGAIHAESKIMKDGVESTSYVLFKDKKMYTWDASTKKGVIFEIPEETMNNIQSQVTTPSTTNSEGESFLAEIEKYKDACKPATVSDSVFTPPSDVEFQDLSSMFQNLPTGAMSEDALPTGFNLEELQKKFAPQN